MRCFKATAVFMGALLAFGSAAIAAPTPEPMGRSFEWDAGKDGAPKSYTAGGLTLTLSKGHDSKADTAPPALAVEGRGLESIALNGAAGTDPPRAGLLVAKLDPKASGPTVLLQTYTGGAHCCMHIDILDPVGGVWKRIDAGDWDGAFYITPVDLDGDGIADIELDDDTFFYAFACYACSMAPPRVFNLVGGEWRDVSASGRYGSLFRHTEAEAKANCVDGGGQNGACAAYVADAARLGHFDAAWAYMLAHYDKTDDWVLPTGCHAVRVKGECPKGSEIVFKTYPEALRNFLQERGYIPHT